MQESQIPFQGWAVTVPDSLGRSEGDEGAGEEVDYRDESGDLESTDG